ncbi:hypothetical protein LITTLEDOG_34 [Serratia phage vB_SmaS_LittleDog]|uniref:Uncharacterized protein n=1 Tax=Serratia phage vB_SmaS_Bigdog TaxID=2777364 RepID=A0A7T3NAA3_9CAUD|nr:hypothetical protein QJS28_gp37 [Serratia phage vB_SmaS_Bigdog]QPX75371.1 hypothetical protein [Serratia phage vB_SmaS_Opt-148]UGO51776.1 hypothetical protein SWAIN_34 [Serratia phage vB_SmaS_Swain]UGO51840.1 hypothetical protein CARROT_34 [Serratia phage vB_SmaS_Carrot]UGO53058.1 hypothetical protein LITTLEDOG_34 [Serratia phage vB_SmaS_LittleDog]QPX75141.1 hypothetical protein BIGDOG_37 [Serratia phage vB_SmaS_Bigdog]
MGSSTVILSGNKMTGNLSPIFFDGAMSINPDNATESPSFKVADSYNSLIEYTPSSSVETIKAPKIETISGVKFISCEIGSGIGVSKFDSLKGQPDFCFVLVADINLSEGQANGIVAEWNSIFNTVSDINAGFFVRRAASATDSLQFTVDGGLASSVSSASVKCPKSGLMVIVASSSATNKKTSIMVNGVESEVNTPASFTGIPGDGAFSFGYRYNYNGTGRMPLKIAKAGIASGYFDAGERLALCNSLMAEYGVKQA